MFLLKLGLSLSLVVALARFLGTEVLQTALQHANAPLLLLGCICCIGQVAITAFKWQLLLNEQGIRVKLVQLFEMQLTGVFVNIFMPSVLFGDAYRAAKLRRHTGSFASALPSVIVDRCTGLAALIAIGVFGLFYVFFPEYLSSAVLGIIASFTAGYLLVVGPISRSLGRLAGVRTTRLIALGNQVAQALKPSRTILYVAMISLAFQFNVVLIVGIWAAGIGLTAASVWNLLVVVPVATFLEMIPISLNGVGVREASYSLLFQEMHLDAAAGFVLGLTVSAMKYGAGLLCGLLLLASPLVGGAWNRVAKAAE